MSAPEIHTVPSTAPLRALRMKRMAERWVEQGGDLRGAPLAVVERAVAARAEEQCRDLGADEVSSVAAGAIHEWEQAEAERAIASARAEQLEAERLAYLRRTAERLKLTGGGR